MTDKTKTRKLLVAYDPLGGKPKSGDFLAAINDSTGLFPFGLRSRKKADQGVMVYLGKDITVNDVFARLVHTDHTFENVGRTLKTLEAYLHMLQEYKIGNILTIERCDDAPCGFRLKKVADSPPAKQSKLPR